MGQAVGIFSIFKGKKTGQVDDLDGFADVPTRMAGSDAERARQREIARATAMKIDAIESAMTQDIFNTPEPAWGSGPRRPRTNAQIQGGGAGAHPTLPMLELATTELLADDEVPEAAVEAQTAPVVEEIAIMYANGQQEVAEAMLTDSLADAGLTERSLWWMLFDLYQISGRQDDFDNIAIDYASRFETSPPTWSPLSPPAHEASYAGVEPTEAFAGLLDAAIVPQLERLAQLAASAAVFRLEFSRVREVTPEGCELLLAALRRLRARALTVVGAAELAELIRGTLTIGARDASEGPWLLRLELLQLLNREKDFEETAMDYCVTYEVSPPQFSAPTNVATAAPARAPVSADRFMLPALLEGSLEPLGDAIHAYAAQNALLVLDCSRLARADYGAAGKLLAILRPLAAAGKKIELRDMNHLVAALFKLLGYAESSRLFPHKY
ncbi:MAG: STAS domain-containing protein [Pseudomonadota bacterium]